MGDHKTREALSITSADHETRIAALEALAGAGAASAYAGDDTFTARSVTSASYATFTGAPSVTITVPASGVVEVSHGGALLPAADIDAQIRLSYAISGANTSASSSARCCNVKTKTTSRMRVTTSKTIRFTGFTPGSTTFALEAQTTTTAGGGDLPEVVNAWIRVVTVP